MFRPTGYEQPVEHFVGEEDIVIVPLVVRAELPTPDAVIVRHDSGQLTIFADVTIPEQRLIELVIEATHDLDERGLALS